EIDAPEGPRACVLFTRAPGALPGEPHPSAAFGRALAALHDATDGLAVPTLPPVVGVDALLAGPVAAMRGFRPDRVEAIAYVQAVAGALARRLDAIGSGLDVGPIHGDLHGGQGHVAADGTVTLFDFDDCGEGWRAYDLAGFRWWQSVT